MRNRACWSAALCLCLAVWPAAAQPPGTAGAAPGSLLIIAPREFVEALQPYAAHRRHDLPTTLVALENALEQGAKIRVAAADELRTVPAADDAERLKRFLFNQWRHHHVRYALLVGDADVMPVRYMCLDRVTPAAFDYAFYPSDLYYADLAKADGSFEDWNAQRDGFHAEYFGEVRGEKNKTDPINYDQINYIPDVAVGRWPVSTPQEAAAVAAKVMRHIDAEARRDAGDRKTGVRDEPSAALIACGGWIENRPAMDGLASALDKAEWVVQKRYFADKSRNDAPPPLPPDAANVVALVNEGFDVIIHSGHGSDDSWAGSITSASIADMHGDDGRLPIMISAGCSTARLATLPPYEAYVDTGGVEHAGSDHGEVFTAPPPPPACYQRGKHNTTGLGEKLLRAPEGGAIAYIGCNTGSQPCGMTLEEGFVLALAAHPLPARANATPPKGSGPLRLGDCWNAAIAHYWKAQHLADLKPVEGEWYPPSIFFQGMKFMLYGDPSLRIAE